MRAADLVTFEMVELSHYCRDFYQLISRFWSYPATSKVTRSAPNSRINKLDTPFDVPSSRSSSALRINIVRQTHKRLKHFLWQGSKTPQIAMVHMIPGLGCPWQNFLKVGLAKLSRRSWTLGFSERHFLPHFVCFCEDYFGNWLWALTKAQCIPKKYRKTTAEVREKSVTQNFFLKSQK